jgi:hypothetical protein
MSQANTAVADGSAIAVREGFNSAIAALLTNNSGSSAPIGPVAQQFWVNTSATPWVLTMYDGAQWVPLGYINATTHLFTPVGAGQPLAFSGLTIANNPSFPNTKIDIAAGSVVVTDGTNYPPLYNVSLTIDTGVTGPNGLDVGTTLAAWTWYYLFVIYNGTTVAGLASRLSTAPTMPSGYTCNRLVGAVVTNGSSQFGVFVQQGNIVIYDQAELISTGTAAQSWSLQGGSAYIPPISTRGFFQISLVAAAAVHTALRKNGSSSAGHPMAAGISGAASTSIVNDWIDTDTDQRVNLYTSATAVSWSLNVLGFALNL